MRGYAVGVPAAASPSNSSKWSRPAGRHMRGRSRSVGRATSTGRTSASACCGAHRRAADRRESGREALDGPLAALLPDQPADRRQPARPCICRCRRFARASPTGAYCSSATPRRSSIPLPERGSSTRCSPAGWPAMPPSPRSAAQAVSRRGLRLSPRAAARTRASSGDDDGAFAAVAIAGIFDAGLALGGSRQGRDGRARRGRPGPRNPASNADVAALSRRALVLGVARGGRRLVHMAAPKVRLSGDDSEVGKRQRFSYVRHRANRRHH